MNILGHWKLPGMWWRQWKLFHNRSSKNVSNSGNIVEPRAQLLKRSTSKVNPLS